MLESAVRCRADYRLVELLQELLDAGGKIHVKGVNLRPVAGGTQLAAEFCLTQSRKERKGENERSVRFGLSFGGFSAKSFILGLRKPGPGRKPQKNGPLSSSARNPNGKSRLKADSAFMNRGVYYLALVPVLLPGAPGAMALPLFLQTRSYVDMRQSIDKEIPDLVWGITGTD